MTCWAGQRQLIIIVALFFALFRESSVTVQSAARRELSGVRWVICTLDYDELDAAAVAATVL